MNLITPIKAKGHGLTDEQLDIVNTVEDTNYNFTGFTKESALLLFKNDCTQAINASSSKLSIHRSKEDIDSYSSFLNTLFQNFVWPKYLDKYNIVEKEINPWGVSFSSFSSSFDFEDFIIRF